MEHPGHPTSAPVPTIAYLTEGRLFVRAADGASREIESPFARESNERRARAQELHGWKERSGLWGNLDGLSSMELWEQADIRRRFRFQCAARGDVPDEIYYVLALENVGGLFRYDLTQEREQRLMHRNNFAPHDLARHPASGSVAVALPRDDGSIGIFIGENDGRFLTGTTTGDCMDEAPAWVPGEGRRIVFQSAGIGRNAAGFPVGVGPYALALLDVDKGQIDTLLEDETCDFLQPRMLADGTLLYIERPYQRHPRTNPWTIVTDVVCFPYRVARAVVHYLNVFSMLYSGQSLITGGGPPRQGPDIPTLRLWGRMVNVKQAMERAARDRPADLVPKEWRLLRRRPDGTEDVLAENVLAFDVGPAGDVVYTNGSRLMHLTPDGQQHEIGTDRLIERVVILES